MQTPRFIFLLLAWAMAPAVVFGVGENLKSLIPVTISGTATGSGYRLVTDVSGSSSTLADNPTTTGISTPISLGASIRPGVVYHFTIDSGSSTDVPTSRYADLAVNILVPVGYVVYVGGTIKTTTLPFIRQSVLAAGMSPIGDNDTATLLFQVLDLRQFDPVPAGTLTRLSVADLVFELSLGTMSNGKSAGRLQLGSDGKPTSGTYGLPADVFSADSLSIAGPVGNGLGDTSWQTISGGKRLDTGQVRVEKIQNSSTKFTVSYFAGNGSGGYGGTAYAVYTLEKITSGLPANAPSSCDCLKITEQQIGASTVTITRYVFRSTTGNSWTLIEGSSGEQRIEVHDSATVSGNREETIYVKDSTATTKAKTKLTWTSELITKQEVWTDVAAGSPGLTTTYTYYSSGLGHNGRVQQITYPNGATRVYDYYDDSPRAGKVKTITEPWSTGSTTYNRVTSYDYTGYNSQSYDYLLSMETKIGTTVMAKTDHSYNFSTTSADSTAQPLVADSVTVYANNFGQELSSTSVSYRNDADFYYADRPYVTRSSTFLQQSYRYEKGSWNGTSFSTGTGTASRTRVVTGSWLGGGPSKTSMLGTTFASIYVIDKQSTMVETIRNNEDQVVAQRTYVWVTSASNFDTTTPVSITTTHWPDVVHPDYSISLNGARQDMTWNGVLAATTKDAAGIELTYGYDTVGRVSTVTQSAVAADSPYQAFAAVTKTYGYDAMGNKISETQAGGSLTSATTWVYDAASRLTETHLPDGRTSSTAYSFPSGSGNLTQTDETLPDGGTRTTQLLIDGKVKQIEGNAQVNQYFSYSYDSTTGDSSGMITTTQHAGTSSSARCQSSTVDWASRVVETRRPGYTGQPDMVEATIYDDGNGLPIEIVRTGLAPEFRYYDYMGNVIENGLDLDNNSFIDVGDPEDRVTDHETVFDKVGSDWWVRTTTTSYPDNDNIVTNVSWTRLTGFASDTLSESAQEDSYGNKVTTTVVVDRAKARVTTSTTYPGISTAAVSVSNNGLTSKMTGTDGRSVTHTYDDLGRLVTDEDSRFGSAAYAKTSYAYKTNGSNATGQLYTVTGPVAPGSTGTLATYGYDSGGRIDSVTNVNADTTYSFYDTYGRLRHQWGPATMPVSYDYDDYGAVHYQYTYRGGSGWTSTTWGSVTPGTADTTTFSYDGPSGLLTQKKDDSNNHVDYTYNDRGLVATRTWARDTSTPGIKVKTTYAYLNNSTELTGKTYNDGTPAVSFGYGRIGQLTSATDVGDGTSSGTRTFEYNAHMQLQTEKLPSYLGSRWITSTYEDGTAGTLNGRYSGYKLGVSGTLAQDLTNLLHYDISSGNISSIDVTQAGISARTFAYAYKPGSSLISGVSESGTGYTQVRDYESYRDLLKEMTTKYGATTKASYLCTYNDLGQRATAIQSGASGTAFADLGYDTYYRYSYDSRGQLLSAKNYKYTGSLTDTTAPLPGRQYEFGYDTAGNRSSSKATPTTGQDTSYTINALNQLTGHTNPYLPVSGTADSAAAVIVNGTVANRQGAYWSSEVTFANSTAPVYSSLIYIKAAKTSPERAQSATPAKGFLGSASETLSYDLDGNLTSDAQWKYTWDAENRLTQMETHPAALQAGLPAQRLVFYYDSTGRRTTKQVWSYTGGSGTWTKISEVRFIYQGWNLIAELNTSGTLQRSYAWGLDMTGSLSTMGGIGALLQVVDHTGTATPYLPGYDASGNVAVLLKAADSSDGTISAAYEYGPFGETLRKTGTWAATNPFRSVTKFTDDESGYAYYGYRYYSPNLGRFINRDPKEEAGGLNLYAFCGNNGINRWDYLGMDADADERARLELAVWWMNNRPDNIGESANQDMLNSINRRGSQDGVSVNFADNGADSIAAGSAGESAFANSINKIMQATGLSFADATAVASLLALGVSFETPQNRAGANATTKGGGSRSQETGGFDEQIETGGKLGDTKLLKAGISVSTRGLEIGNSFDKGSGALIDFAGTLEHPLSPFSLMSGVDHPFEDLYNALDAAKFAFDAVTTRPTEGGDISGAAGNLLAQTRTLYDNHGPFVSYTVVQTATYKEQSFLFFFTKNEWVPDPAVVTRVDGPLLMGTFGGAASAASAATVALKEQLKKMDPANDHHD